MTRNFSSCDFEGTKIVVSEWYGTEAIEVSVFFGTAYAEVFFFCIFFFLLRVIFIPQAKVFTMIWVESDKSNCLNIFFFKKS